MSILWDGLPEYVEYEGRRYKLSPAFDNVLRMFAEIEDDRLTEVNKLEIMLYYLIDGKHPLDAGLLQAVAAVLFPDTGKRPTGPKAFDYEQDAGLVYAAFRQVYGIDLQAERGKLHWLTFQTLLAGLPNGTRLGDIINIRVQPVPAANRHNADEINRLMRLKAEYRLKSETASFQTGLARMAQYMMEQAKR